MFGMLGGKLALWLARSALMSSPVGGALKGGFGLLQRIPKPVWEALTVAAYVIALICLHQHYANAAISKAYKDGFAAARKQDQEAADQVRAKAEAYKVSADAANVKIYNERKVAHDQVVAVNHRLADALRVRAAAAAVHPVSGGRGHLPGATDAAVRTGGPPSPADAQLGAGPAPVVCVDAGQLIDYAEQADDEHDALEKAEDAWKQYRANQPVSAPSPPR